MSKNSMNYLTGRRRKWIQNRIKYSQLIGEKIILKRCFLKTIFFFFRVIVMFLEFIYFEAYKDSNKCTKQNKLGVGDGLDDLLINIFWLDDILMFHLGKSSHAFFILSCDEKLRSPSTF